MKREVHMKSCFTRKLVSPFLMNVEDSESGEVFRRSDHTWAVERTSSSELNHICQYLSYWTVDMLSNIYRTEQLDMWSNIYRTEQLDMWSNIYRTEQLDMWSNFYHSKSCPNASRSGYKHCVLVIVNKPNQIKLVRTNLQTYYIPFISLWYIILRISSRNKNLKFVSESQGIIAYSWYDRWNIFIKCL